MSSQYIFKKLRIKTILPVETGMLPSDGQWACAARGAGFGLEDGIGMEETEPRTGRAAPVDEAADPK